MNLFDAAQNARWHDDILAVTLGSSMVLASLSQQPPHSYWSFEVVLQFDVADEPSQTAQGWDTDKAAARRRAEQAMWLMLALVEVQNANLHDDAAQLEHLLAQVRASGGDHE